MPSDGWVSNREVEAAWSCTLLQPASLRATSCVSFAKFASDRAYLGKERIKSRLIGDLDPAEWDLPPKPKWMRWETCSRYVERFDDYERTLDQASISSVVKRLG